MDRTSHHPRSAGRCRLCFKSGYFHLSIFSSDLNIANAIQDIFNCTVRSIFFQQCSFQFLSIFGGSKILIYRTNYFSFQVSEVDSLPHQICVDCWMTVCPFYSFYKTVLSTQHNFVTGNALNVKVEDNFEEAYEYYTQFLSTLQDNDSKPKNDVEKKLLLWCFEDSNTNCLIPFLDEAIDQDNSHTIDVDNSHTVFIKELDESEDYEFPHESDNGKLDNFLNVAYSFIDSDVLYVFQERFPIMPCHPQAMTRIHC